MLSFYSLDQSDSPLISHNSVWLSKNIAEVSTLECITNAAVKNYPTF